MYENEYDEDNSFVPPKFDHLRIRTYNWLYNVLDKPYSRWGTYYSLDLDALRKEAWGEGIDPDAIDKLKSDEVLKRLGSDYDENGIPYWDYDWHVDPITGDAWRIHAKK